MNLQMRHQICLGPVKWNISLSGPSPQLKSYTRLVPKYIKHKYVVQINILLTPCGIVCDTLKIKMKGNPQRQAEDNLTKLYNENFYSSSKCEWNRTIKWIKYEYRKQFKYLFLWNDVCRIDIIASNVCVIIITEQWNHNSFYFSHIWFFYLSSLSHRRFNKFLAFFFTFCSRRKVYSIFSFQCSFVFWLLSIW